MIIIIYNKIIYKKNNVSSSLATFGNIIEMCKKGIWRRNLSTKFLKGLNIHLFSKRNKKVQIVML